MAIPIYDLLFPTRIAATARGSSARFMNRRMEGAGGDISVTAVWERHVGHWSIASIPFRDSTGSTQIPPEDIQKAIDMFWWSRGGKGFWFRPPAGYVVRSGQGVIIDSAYYRRYEPAAGLTYDRLVHPDPDTLIEAGATWTGEFWVPVVFDMDALEEEAAGGADGNLLTLPAIEVIEVPNYTIVE